MMPDKLQELSRLTARAADVSYDTVQSGAVGASQDDVAFLVDDPVYAEAVALAHDKAGNGEWVVLGLDLPKELAEELAPRFQKALKASRFARDED